MKYTGAISSKLPNVGTTIFTVMSQLVPMALSISETKILPSRAIGLIMALSLPGTRTFIFLVLLSLLEGLR